MPNRLALASSAYLRQHADNPVEWFEWGDEAFNLARESDRPVLLSIGYAACHWCHVMAHESFENAAIADIMNRDFVCVKIDREERPDVDAVYMAATQAVTGSGGWPMTVFCAPDGRPFMAGTYFPPVDRGGMPGFPRLLAAMADAWRNQRATVLDQAEQIANAVRHETTVLDRLTPANDTLRGRELGRRLADALLSRRDPDGGFSGAPKFPRPSYVRALLPFVHEADALDAVRDTLDAMSRRGLYDHLAGGFARYSVDSEWHVPHFEKMLSDQAQLALVYLEADRALGGNTPYRAVALDTLHFVLRDLAVEKGLASSLDADSGGEEGAHVTWTRDDVRAVLEAAGRGGDLDAVCSRWRIEIEGSFEGRSIPRLAGGEPFALPASLVDAHAALLAARRTRTQPGRDDKVVLSWNAMTIVALLASDDEHFVTEALERLASLRATHHRHGRSVRTPEGLPASVADVAWFLRATLEAYARDGDDEHLDAAHELAEELFTHYGDWRTTASGPALVGFFTSADDATDTFVRPADVFDGAEPSGLAVAFDALARLTLLAPRPAYEDALHRLRTQVQGLVADHGVAAPDLVWAATLYDEGVTLVLPGGPSALRDVLHSVFVPCAVVATGNGRSPLLVGRSVGAAYHCAHGTCALPATTVDGWRAQLTSAATWR